MREPRNFAGTIKFPQIRDSVYKGRTKRSTMCEHRPKYRWLERVGSLCVVEVFGMYAEITTKSDRQKAELVLHQDSKRGLRRYRLEALFCEVK